MKKKLIDILLLQLIALLSPHSALADGHVLVVELHNGGTDCFELCEKPVLSFIGECLLVETNTLSVSFRRAEIKRSYFKTDDIGIQEAEFASNRLVFKQTGAHRLEIRNLSEADDVVVCHVSGRRYRDCVSRQGDGAVVDLSQCQKGIYVIKVSNKQTIKMTNR